MQGLNEADTYMVYITPALKTAGWREPHWRIAEQHYFTDRQLNLAGDGHRMSYEEGRIDLTEEVMA